MKGWGEEGNVLEYMGISIRVDMNWMNRLVKKLGGEVTGMQMMSAPSALAETSK